MTPEIEARDRYLQQRKKAKVLAVPNHPETPKIDHHIPPPVEARGGVRKFDHFYPFEEMKPGDSFWVPSQTYCTAGAVTKFAAKSGWKFISRGQSQDGKANSQVGNKSKRGTRVWRVS